MLISVETWTIFGVEDEGGIIPHVVGAHCPSVDSHDGERLPCLSGLRRCEYFRCADSKGIECLYNELETDIIDGETLDDKEEEDRKLGS